MQQLFNYMKPNVHPQSMRFFTAEHANAAQLASAAVTLA